MKLENVIGLEIHVQLKTKSKMFCACSNDGSPRQSLRRSAGENQAPNTTICPVCLGHPGTLPVPNKQAIEWSVKTALALNCTIPHHSKFDRKHYFYPDLPKAYQISQYDEPIGTKGHLGEVRIHRLHLEEDAAKLLHKNGESFVDYNRGGTPLMEIVTEADIKTPEQAGEFLRELRLIMRYLGVSDADMEKGHLRCDANISLRPVMASRNRPLTPSLVKEGALIGGSGEILYPKTEIKNLNSFKAVERALSYEIIRQTKVWKETGEAPEEQGTRGWDENEGKTFVQRVKEEANDYRYFPEPDIPELDFDKNWVTKLKAELPELPNQLRGRFQEQYGFNAVDAKIISQDRALASFIEETISELLGWLESSGQEGSAEEIWEKNKAKLSKLVSGWVLSKLLGALSKTGKELADITPENMAELITLIYGNKTNATNAVIILEEVLNTKTNPTEIMNAKDLGQMSDDGAVEAAVDKVISDNPKQVAEFKAGKEAVLQYLVGQVMKATRGKADAASAGQILKNKLS